MLRIALLVVLFLLLVSVVVGVVAGETGALEKAVLVVFGLVLIWLVRPVRRIGAGPAPE